MNEEIEIDLGNFSDFEEQTDLDACGGDNNYKIKSTAKANVNECANESCKDGICADKSKENLQLQETIEIPKDKLCRKCKLQRATVKLRNDICCKECYISALDHKFRSGLRTNLNIGKSDSLLLCISGGPNSMAMGKLVSESLHNPITRKMFYVARILYIDEGSIYNFDNEKRKANIQKMRDYAQELKLCFDYLKIEDIYKLKSDKLTEKFAGKQPESQEEKKVPEEDAKISVEKTEKVQKTGKPAPGKNKKDLDEPLPVTSPTVEFEAENIEKLKQVLTTLSDTGSSKEDVLFQFKQYLIHDFALKNGVTKIALGDTAQKIAVKSLSQICKGRGANLLNEVGIIDAKFPELKVTRPMNDLLTKEVLFYNHHFGIDKHLLLNPALCEISEFKKSNLPANGNIDHLLEDFITKLQGGFPSTVHTVLNTLDKVKSKKNLETLCPLCLGKKDKLVNVLEKGSIIEHLTQEKQVDNDGGTKADIIDITKECEKMKTNYMQSKFYTNKTSLEKVCCFGCGRAFENAKDPEKFSESLPEIIKTHGELALLHSYANLHTEKEFQKYMFYDEDVFSGGDDGDY